MLIQRCYKKMKTYKTNYYQTLMLKKSTIVKAKPIWLPFGIWYKRKHDFQYKIVLDFGSSIRSNFFKKFKKDNNNCSDGYWGFDLDVETTKWLKKNKFYYSFYDDNRLKRKLDVINASQVYEHLTLDERELFIQRSHELLKKEGVLLIDFPYINNLNLIEFFHGDRTHKPVSCEDEANYITSFGFECEVYIGGLTWPYQSLLKGIWTFIWNILLGYYPFHITLIKAIKI